MWECFSNEFGMKQKSDNREKEIRLNYIGNALIIGVLNPNVGCINLSFTLWPGFVGALLELRCCSRLWWQLPAGALMEVFYTIVKAFCIQTAIAPLHYISAGWQIWESGWVRQKKDEEWTLPEKHAHRKMDKMKPWLLWKCHSCVQDFLVLEPHQVACRYPNALSEARCWQIHFSSKVHLTSKTVAGKSVGVVKRDSDCTARAGGAGRELQQHPFLSWDPCTVQSNNSGP